MKLKPTHENPLPCDYCDATGYIKINGSPPEDCTKCKGLGWFGINPELPIPHSASSKCIPYYQVRYASSIFTGQKLEDAELI